jgi:hypothetical protein
MVPFGILLAVGHAALEVILNDIDGELVRGNSISGMSLHYRGRLLIVVVNSALSIEPRLYPQR